MEPRHLPFAFLLATLWLLGCSDQADDNGGEGNSNGGVPGSSGATSLPPGSGGTTGGIIVPGSSGGTDPGSAGACAAQTAEAQRKPVFLAFAFDVSGSMGKLDYDWHDPALKWQPVVAATQAFFADPNSVGISASLTFFPGEDSICDAETYETPDVPMTILPSGAFAEAITAVTPESSDDWRGGTPTLAVVTGVMSQLEAVVAENPGANVSLVLVTDGFPQGCDENDIELVEAAVAAHPEITTYVIGVENPPIEGAPDTVSNLNGVAESGGTGTAFIIQTGDPGATSTQFAGVIESIRGAAISCELAMPDPPAGQTLATDQVNVTYTSGAAATPYFYDPSCAAANSWHYDDPLQPTAVILCPNDCTAVMADPNAAIVVEFGCAQRTPITK